MAKFRTIEEKTRILRYILSTKPNSKDRPFEFTDLELLAPDNLEKICRYPVLWDYIDLFIGKPLDGHKKSILWNKITEAIHYAR